MTEETKAAEIERELNQLDAAGFARVARHVHDIEIGRWQSHVPPPGTAPWFMRALYAVTVLVVFFRGVWPRSTYRFDSDDIMNLHQGYVVPAAELLRDLVFPFTAFNRPLGALYYRLCFDLFGWNPPAFRTVTIALMMANLTLVYLLARRLTGSIEMGAMAALLFSFHGRLVEMYASNGTVYDVLCALFSLLTVWYYVRVRQESRSWNGLRIILLLLFYIAALNAKEMAALIPVLLVV
jgi:hypothetical protein